MAARRRRRGREARLLPLVASALSALVPQVVGQEEYLFASITVVDQDNAVNIIDPGDQATVVEAPDYNLKLHAGARYGMKLTMPIAHSPTAVADNLRFRLVRGSKTDCSSLLGDRYVKGSWGATTGAQATYSAGAAAGFELNVAETLEFLMGGDYKFCLSLNGNFAGDQVYLIPVKMMLKGVYDHISTGKLADRSYYCYLKKKAFYGHNSAAGTYTATETSCRVWFAYSSTDDVGFMTPYDNDRGSWGAEFGIDALTRATIPKECGTTDPSPILCKAPNIPGPGACNVGVRRITPADPNERTIRIPTAIKTLEGANYKARSIAACYCPGYLSCDGTSDFVQQVGVLHFFLTKICEPGFGCAQDFTGVTPQYRFKVLVQCPTDACRSKTGTRMKLIEKKDENDLPSWMSNSGCRTGKHGELRNPRSGVYRKALLNRIIPGIGVHYPFGESVTPAATNPADCDPLIGCPQTGQGVIDGPTGDYETQDYKEFGGSAGFQFMMGSTNHEARNFYRPYELDACFCVGDCTTESNWFKSGTMRVTPTRLVSSATSQSNLPAQWSIEFVNQAGTIAIYRSYDDEYTMGLQENGMLIKVVQDRNGEEVRPAYADYKCWKSGYDAQLISGPSDEGAASFNYAGTTTPPETQRIVFNAGFAARTIVAQKAGRVAICYCGRVDDSGLCRDGGDLSPNWRMVAQMNIKGPRMLPQQRWTFSTMVTFRFAYAGFGLSEYDKVRIIDFSGKCTDDNFNPNRAAYEYTFIKIDCPTNCKRVNLTTGPGPGNLVTRVRTAACSTFNPNHGQCERNDITQVTVISETQTEIVFQKAHGFKDGDEITLGDNIACDPTDTVCTDEALGAVKGVYDFQDIGNKDYQAPSTYATPHVLSTVPNQPNRARISIGWPEPRPKFAVIFAGTDPNRPDIIGQGGLWTHHSEGITKEEITGEQARANMKVCWSYGRPEAPTAIKYVEEVGLLTITDPAVMEEATISISALKMGVPAPMILQFRTAPSEQIGLKYDQAVDSLRLKVIFTHPNQLDIRKTDLDGPEISYDESVDFTQASQQTCGKLFLELWSEDMERGFPLPKGCYFRSFRGAEPRREIERREIELIFEPKSGLRKNTIYQMVFNGVIKDVLDSSTNELTQDTFMQVIPMDDLSLRPYEAIERGIVRIHPDGPIPKSDPVDAQPEFNKQTGFKLVGGYNNLLELQSGDMLSFELMGGEKEGNKIESGCRIRIFLWPFTQWQTTSSCTAGCIVGGEASFLCEHIQCDAEAIVPGMNLNVIKLTLGKLNPTWQGFGELYNFRKARIRVGAVTMPPGGFFAQRLAAQVTDAGIRGNTDVLDQYPDYVLSVGDLIWKAPSEGQTVAKVISVAGGGNTKPFKQDTGNILYARLMLSSTLWAHDDTGEDVSFRISLPKGYSCLQPPAGDANAWEAPTTLPAFGTEVPQGRGTPDDGTINHGWSTLQNTCTFTPAHPYGVVYHGSSMIVRIQVNNPATALKRSSDGNMWTFRMVGRGLCGTTLCIKQGEDREYNFLSSPDKYYQSNNVVLGRIVRSAIQPTNFELRGVRDPAQDLHIFFQTEQEVPGGGHVIVKSPYGFNFGVPECVAGNLEGSYYATDGNPATATLRLPVDASLPKFPCETAVVSDPGDTVTYQEVRIRLRDILMGGRYYGFKVKVDNPADMNDFKRTGWRIYTLDADGYAVDGTPSTVPFIDGEGNSWGVYQGGTGFDAVAKVQQQAGLTIGGTSVPDMLPYRLTRRAVYVTLEMKNVPEGESGAIRVVLPDTYEWDFTTMPLIFRRPTDALVPVAYRASAPAGITVPFPPCIKANAQAASCPFGRDGATKLLFVSAAFAKKQTYGFAAPIRVPDRNPSVSSNAIFLELGYEQDSVLNRKAAASVPLPDVRTLRNTHVDYTTSVKAKETALQFSLETVTDIPAGGFIQILAPQNFKFADDCYIIRVNDPSAPAPPALACAHVLTPAGPRIRLTVPSGVLYAGLQAFAILADNPREPYRNYANAGTSCGTDTCWYFNTSKVPIGGGVPEALDMPASAQGYSVNDKMLEARIPSLTSVQNYATGRDDRPLQNNNVIFAFQLSSNVTRDAEMVLRAPYGFLFQQECSKGVVVDAAMMFGLGNRFPDEFTVWPNGVTIESCRGSGKDARLQVRIAPGAMLRSSRIYIVRVGNFSNPLATPEANQWTLEIGGEFAGEASEPIQGMSLWAFTGTRITPIVTARDQTLAGEVRTQNPLRFLFRPFNTVPQEGELRAAAPEGFIFSHRVTRECDVMLRELPYVELGVQYPGYTWPEDKLVCLADADDSSKVSVRLRDPRPVVKGLEYELILVAYNARATSTTAAAWTLSSFLPGNLPLDESRISGFVVNEVMDLRYSNPDPGEPSQEVRNGRAALPQFVLRMQFPDKLTTGDRIVIIVPREFVFTDFAGACLNYRVECNKEELAAGQECPNIIRFPPVCNATEKTITFLINQSPPVPEETLIMFGIGMTNPALTMAVSENFWRCTHYGPMLAEPPQRGFRYRENSVEAKLPIHSSKAFMSWDIIPQLEDVKIDIVDGEAMAAGATSAITISFKAVTDAEDVAIRFVQPLQFEFGGAYLDEADPAQTLMLDTGGPLARVRTTVTAGRVTTITLRNVQLGRDGGQTLVRLTTWTGGLLIGSTWNEGTKKDERLDCGEQCSFLLPGLVDISYEKLENQYHQNPDAFPVQSRWEAQMGRPAQITFRFHVTQAIKVGQELWIFGKPYQPTLQTFSLAEAAPITLDESQTDDPAARAVKYALKDVLNQTIKVTLEQTLVPFQAYEVTISVIAPSPTLAAASGAIRWTLESWSYPYGDKPTNTNDGNTRVFPIVEEYDFRVETHRAPPIANVEVDLIVQPGLQKPTALIVVAPLLFNFSAGCLVDGGGVVTNCNPSTPMPNGRPTARLDIVDTGFPNDAPPIRIVVMTPRKAPLSVEWFVEGRDVFSDAQFGWGEATGIEIEQMAETSVAYPGIPGIPTRMVWRFQTQVLVEAGGWLQVSLPEGFNPTCENGALVAIALPKTGGCNMLDPQTLIITLNSTMVPGEYVFAFGIEPPTLQPIRNEVSLIMKDENGVVRDAAIDLPGLPIQPRLKIAEAPLRWTQAKPLRSSMVTLGFEAMEPLPDLVVAPLEQVSEILITLPVGFTHLVGELNDFAVLNEDMPFKDGDWLDYLQKDRLRIVLNLNRSAWTTLKTGKYEFRFPVLVPAALPTFNVWHMALCSPNYPEGCNRITDPAVLVIYPMPGFELGQVYTGPGALNLGSTAGAAGFQATVPVVWWLVLASYLVVAVATGSHPLE